MLVFSLALSLSGGCKHEDESAAQPSEIVVLYTSVDEPFVRPLVQKFQQQTGITVKILTDGEAAKTVGLSERVIAEKDHPQGDVYWGNEPFHTINMAEQNVFAPHTSPAGADIRPRWRNKANLYQTIGLRARMIVVSTSKESAAVAAQVHTLKDLTKPALKGKIGMASPAFGTTSGQVAAWYLNWGDGPTDDFLRALKANQIELLGGNSNVVDKTADGSIVAGLTDNDDIANGKADNQKVDAIALDANRKDALLIPTTIAEVKGCPHPDAANKLIDFLMEAEVEKQLIDSHFLAFSARDSAVESESMDVDYTEIAHRMPAAVQRALAILQGR
jgi:iron(III) transport system substrate-binding protein